MTVIFLPGRQARGAGDGAVGRRGDRQPLVGAWLLMAPRKLAYDAGKSAVIGMTRRMAIDFGPLGIRVNAICPGHIVTERIAPQWDAQPDGLRYFARQYPVRRSGVL